MRVAHLKVQNFGGIELVETSLAEGLNIVAGDNGSGKSSLIAALQTVTLGKDGLPPAPVHQGSEKAIVLAKFSDGSSAEASLTAGGTWSFRLRDPQGVVVASPNAALAKLRGAAGPDPLSIAFSKDPRLEILKAVGVDTAALDTEERNLRETRTITGREVKTLAGAVESMPPLADVPSEEISIATLAAEVTKAEMALQRDIQRLAAERNRLEEISRCEAALAASRAALANEEDLLSQILEPSEDPDIAAMERALAEAKLQAARNADIRRRRDECAARVAKAQSAAEAASVKLDSSVRLVTPPAEEIPDVEALRKQLASADQTNGLVRANRRRLEAEEKLKAKRAEYDGLTLKIDAFPERRNALLRDAGLSVEGLQVTPEGVSLHGVPWAAASTGERLAAAIAIRAATKADLAVAWTTMGAMLDETHIAHVAKLCESSGLQLIMEVVGEDHEGALVLREGRVLCQTS